MYLHRVNNAPNANCTQAPCTYRTRKLKSISQTTTHQATLCESTALHICMLVPTMSLLSLQGPSVTTQHPGTHSVATQPPGTLIVATLSLSGPTVSLLRLQGPSVATQHPGAYSVATQPPGSHSVATQHPRTHSIATQPPGPHSVATEYAGPHNYSASRALKCCY